MLYTRVLIQVAGVMISHCRSYSDIVRCTYVVRLEYLMINDSCVCKNSLEEEVYACSAYGVCLSVDV